MPNFAECIWQQTKNKHHKQTNKQTKTKRHLKWCRCYSFTNESQDHRMAWLEKDHNGHGRQPPDQAAQSHIQPGLECLQGWGIHSLLGQPVQCVTTLWVKNFRLISNLNLPCLSLNHSRLSCQQPQEQLVVYTSIRKDHCGLWAQWVSERVEVSV